MKPYIFILLLLIAPSIMEGQSYSKQLKKISQFLEKEYPKNEPGAVILIAKDGEILLKKAYGLASIKPKRKMKTNMVFPIGSMTKQFTSAAILQLVEQGKMSLTDSIQKYVPFYPSKKYPISLHHLLSQTSGIPEFFDVDENEFYILSQEHTPKQLIGYYKDLPLQYKPGEKWEYSNSNYPLLGAAIEKITGMSLKDYFEKNVFAPLQMKSSGLWYSNSIKSNQIPTGYTSKNGKWKKGPKMLGSTLYAPGGVVASVDDLYRWNRALKAKKKISQFVYEQLTSPKKTNDGKSTGYGYGLFIRNLQGSSTLEHGGNLFSFTSGGLYLPKEDVFVCILSNTIFDRVQEISNYIASVLINRPLKILSKGKLSADILKDYIGFYALDDPKLKRNFELKVYDNLLILHDPKAPKNDAILTPLKKDAFLFKSAGATFIFKRNEKNQVIGYTVKQKKDQFIFQKIK